MLLNLGVSSAVSQTSPLHVACHELWSQRSRRLGRRPPSLARVALWLHLFGFVSGLCLYTQRSGVYWVELADHFVPMIVTITAALGQVILVSRYYGARRLVSRLPACDRALRSFWLIEPLLVFSWRFFLPALLALLLAGQLVHEMHMPYGGYPSWALAVGWVLAFGPLALVCVFWFGPKRGAQGKVDEAS